MKRMYRILLAVIAILQGIIGIAFALRISTVTDLWVLPYTGSLSFIFIGSIFLAAAVSTGWCLLKNEDGALAGVGLDYLFILIPLAVLSFQSNTSTLRTFGFLCLAGMIFGVIMLVYGLRIPIRDTRSQPLLARVSFALFIIALLVVGGNLILKNNVMPWNIPEQSAIVYGWMFIGAAAYFAYGLLRPSWGNSAGQLAGFLAYDLVLILPFLTRFTGDPIPEQYVVGHIVYTAVVIYSGALAVYFLFIAPKLRSFGARGTADAQ